MAKLTRSRFLRQMLLGVLSCVCVVTFAACGANQGGSPTATGGEGTTGAETTTLRVATEPAFPPFESQGSGGELEGFDIDLMNAIGEAAGFTVQFQSLPFDGIIPALQSGTVDAAISAMTITAERAQTVDFSRPYFKAGLAIAVQESDTEVTSFDDLQNKRIAVQIGTTGAAEAAKIEGAQIRTFDSAPLALQELANGNVDAVINDAPVTLYAVQSGNIGGVKVIGQLITEEFYGIAIPKGSPNVEAINQGLATILEDGTYNELHQKWFGEDAPDLPETAPI
ncbi:basic amino acid ABC transporter substrate-binding protein [Oculatella sp. LEGE 06141]|uniref:basic amino acid ABC transporter substrate-binding protein n=1 Tax=Oculatella sp. LEGE 06141 TaxID=1828648 RepID=UPI00187F9150|nr:basic amino acid ABC transporter substrate-binding protein [Oculatella sp. LEGE 06141]MBE9179001.1 basic amino acid ABC transporter substrate-binding protein [Oculatella sp. LEGE 06141]